ncbi:hypothetical protein D3C86_2105440 [compost metagenome]
MLVSALAWSRTKAALASSGLSFQATFQWPWAADFGSAAWQPGCSRLKSTEIARALSLFWLASQRQA